MKKGLAILFAVLCLFLCACHRDTDTTPQTISLTNVYTAAPEMQADVSSCQPFVYGDSLYLFDRIQNLNLYRFSLDGTYRETIAVPSLHEESLSLRQALLLDNGDFLGLAKSITDETYFLLQFRSDASIVHRAAIEEGDSSLLLLSQTMNTISSTAQRCLYFQIPLHKRVSFCSISSPQSCEHCAKRTRTHCIYRTVWAPYIS